MSSCARETETTSTSCSRDRRGGVVDIDLEVEGIVDRIGSITSGCAGPWRRRSREHGLTHPDWGVLTTLRLWRSDHRSSPGELAADLELSSGAMTSRLDRLEEAGYVRRLPRSRRPARRRRRADGGGPRGLGPAASVQGRREAFFASALTKAEQQQLNTLLRKLMLAFDAGRRRSRGRRRLRLLHRHADGAVARPSIVRARAPRARARPARPSVSHVVAHGSVVAVASTVPSTTNSTRATGPIVWARQSTTPLTV